MKNRLILPIVLCVLLCTCFAAAYGDSSESNDLLIPEEFVSNYNEAIALMVVVSDTVMGSLYSKRVLLVLGSLPSVV